MKKFYGNYLGLCIDNNDPQKRGRVQVFVPHILPTLFENWNEVGEDIQLLCVGDNLPASIPPDILEKLKKVLPWAEASLPIMSTSAPGNLVTGAAAAASNGGYQPSTVAGVAGAGVAIPQSTSSQGGGSYYNQSPVPDPTPVGLPSNLPNSTGNITVNPDGSINVPGLNVNNSIIPGRTYGISATRNARPFSSIVIHDPGGPIRLNNLINYVQTYDSNRGGTFGYSLIIDRDGSVYQTAPWNARTNHIGPEVRQRVPGLSNSNSLGISLMGNSTDVTQAQQASLQRIIAASGIRNIYGHGELTPNRMPSEGIIARQMRSIFASGAAYETTSTSVQTAATNPLNSPNPIDERASIAVPVAGNTGGGGGTLSAPGVGQVSEGSGSIARLAQDRQRYFANELNDPAILQRLSYLAWQEVDRSGPSNAATGSNVNQQTAFIETVVNRAFFSGRSLSTVLNETAYGFRPGISRINPATQTAFNRVIGGSNITNLATDNASNAPGNPVADRRIAAGVTGSWFSSGQVVGRNEGEFFYRANGRDGYSSTAGLNATRYAQTNGLEGAPTGVSTETGMSVEGVPETALPDGVVAAEGETGLPQTGGNLVGNPDSWGPTPVINMNNMAAGMFAYPAAGALLWVFFREGNPLFPVYFGASYGEREWASAYRLPGPGQDGVGYKPSAADGNPITSYGGTWSNKAFVHTWHCTDDPTNPLNNERSYAIGGHDGSNISFTEGLQTFFTKFDRRDQIEGDRWVTTLGYEERWNQGNTNSNTLGDVVVRIGNTSQEAVDAVNKINDYIKQIMQPLTVSDCSEAAQAAPTGQMSQDGTQAVNEFGQTVDEPLPPIEGDGTLTPQSSSPYGGTANQTAGAIFGNTPQTLGSVGSNVVDNNARFGGGSFSGGRVIAGGPTPAVFSSDGLGLTQAQLNRGVSKIFVLNQNFGRSTTRLTPTGGHGGMTNFTYNTGQTQTSYRWTPGATNPMSLRARPATSNNSYYSGSRTGTSSGTVRGIGAGIYSVLTSPYRQFSTLRPIGVAADPTINVFKY